MNLMKKITISIFLLLAIFSFSFDFVSSDTGQNVVLHFFYGSTCPYCKKAEEFLKTLEERYPQLQIKSYEVFGNKKNADLFLAILEACGREKEVRVPSLFVGEETIIGYLNQETTGVRIENAVKECLEKTCEDPLKKLNLCENCSCDGGVCDCEICDCKPQQEEESQIVFLPMIGRIDLSRLSLPALTLVVGLLDGLNPCAMWVLLFLLTLLINTRSRKRMWLIAGTFIVSSGVVYYLVLAAWLNLFLTISYVNLTRTAIGIFALGFGIWQIKDFMTKRPGVCKITEGNSKLSTRIKNGLKNHAEKLVFSPLTLAIVGGVIILAVGVNLVEFFCSAGLPAIYTRILTLNQLSRITYYLYLLFYAFLFMLDDLVIFSLAIITLSRVKFSEKYNYWSTLIGGVLIFILGILLIFKPELLMFT